MIAVNTGGKDFLASEEFFALGDGYTSITLGPEGESLTFILNFQKNKEPSQHTETVVVSPTSLRFDLSNWDSTSLMSWTEPFEVGSYNGRDLYMLLSVTMHVPSPVSRRILVVFYLGEESTDGPD
ncbi:MAG: hypothetical protein V4542_09915 [Pseudomonadota bacterium]